MARSPMAQGGGVGTVAPPERRFRLVAVPVPAQDGLSARKPLGHADIDGLIVLVPALWEVGDLEVLLLSTPGCSNVGEYFTLGRHPGLGWSGVATWALSAMLSSGLSTS